MSDPVTIGLPASTECGAFSQDGFIIVDDIISADMCAVLNARLEAVLRGACDGHFGKPDKMPKRLLNAPAPKPGKKQQPLGGPSKQTLQVINIWKAIVIMIYIRI